MAVKTELFPKPPGGITLAPSVMPPKPPAGSVYMDASTQGPKSVAPTTQNMVVAPWAPGQPGGPAVPGPVAPGPVAPSHAGPPGPLPVPPVFGPYGAPAPGPAPPAPVAAPGAPYTPPGMPAHPAGAPPALPNMGVSGVSPGAAPATPMPPNALAGPGYPSLFQQPITAAQNTLNPATMTVQGRLQSMLDKNNPLMVKAREDATRMAAGRGLQNSSIAAGAGEQALFASALPAAQQDAATAAQMGMADTAAKNQFGLNQQQFAQNMELAKQQFGFNTSLSAQDAYQQLQKLAAEGDQKAKLALLDFGFQRDLTTLQGQIANDRANNDFANKLVELTKQGDIASKLQFEKFGFDTKLTAQENLAKLQQLAAQGDVNAKLQLQQFQFQSLLNDQQNGFALDLEDTRFQNGQNTLMLEFQQRGVLSAQEAKQQTAYLNQQHANTLAQIDAQVKAQMSGDTAAAGRALQNNYLVSVADRQRAGSDEIAKIYSTPGLKPEQQQAAVQNAYARMQQDLLVLRTFYQQSPMWDPKFGGAVTPPATPAPGTPATPRPPTAPGSTPTLPGGPIGGIGGGGGGGGGGPIRVP